MGIRISDLSSLSSPSGSDILPIVDSGTTKKVTIDILGAYIADNYGSEGSLEGDAVGNINMQGYSISLGTDSGTSGGDINMDGGQIVFPDIGGNYDVSAWISTGSFGEFGGISQFCYVGFEENWQNGVLSLSGPTGSHPNSYVSNHPTGAFGTITGMVGYDLNITAFTSQLLTLNFDTVNYWSIYSQDNGNTLSFWCGDVNTGITLSEFDEGVSLNILGNYINLNSGSGSGGGRLNIDGGQIRDTGNTLIYSDLVFYGGFNGAFTGDGSNLTNINITGSVNSILVDGNGDVITSEGYVLTGA